MPFTLIQTCNNVLLNCGERPIINTNNVIGEMVKNSIRTALVDVANANDWLWLRSSVIADSWSKDRATLPNTTQRLRGVSYDTTVGHVYLTYTPESEFIKYLPSYGFKGLGGCPRIYTYDGQRSCRVLPYPDDGATRARVWFHIVRWLTMPNADNDAFTVIPDEFMELVISKASYLFGVHRHGDPSKFVEHGNQYEKRMRELRSRQMGAITSGHNMYKRGRQ